MKNTITLTEIVNEAHTVAREAAAKFFNEKMNNIDGGSCGFAWVDIYKFNGKKLDGRSKIAKGLKEAGVNKSYTGGFQIWNPSSFPVQNIDTLEAGARAAAEVFRKYGFEAYAGSRLD